MKTFIISMLVFTAWATSLPAQITREQADAIVLEHVKNEVTPPYQLYANLATPGAAGISLTTHQEEAIRAKYACWAYYLDENPETTEPTQHRYLFVKENDGNLLEIMTNNDLSPNDLTTQWEKVTGNGIDEVQNEVRIYPNPTNGELRIKNYELRIEQIQIFDMMGRVVSRDVACYVLKPITNTTTTLDISHLPSGIYLVKIKAETGVITQKIVKN